MIPKEPLSGRGCSSVVERVLRMYEAPGSNPGSSICVFPSSAPFIFVTHIVTFPLPLFFF